MLSLGGRGRGNRREAANFFLGDFAYLRGGKGGVECTLYFDKCAEINDHCSN